jgi:hypothetical protein
VAEPFKNLINADVVRQAGQHLGQALQATLPDDFHHAADVLEASFKSVTHVEDPDKELGLLRTDDTGLADWLERHASRTLIKQGHGRTLTLWGLGTAFDGNVRWQVSPKRIAIGESVALNLALASTSASTQALEIDYTVHHARAQGGASAKTFKGWRMSLAPGETLSLAKLHSMRPVTTRRYHPGEHQIDLRINGQIVAQAGFKLTA